MGYYVHVPGKGEPTLEHTYYKDALEEANRLALKNKKDVRIYELKATVKIKYSTEVEHPTLGIQESNGKEYYPGDCVLFVDFDKTHETGVIKNIMHGMADIVTQGDVLKAIPVEDIVTVIH